MTEAEWDACTSPAAMMDVLPTEGAVADRKWLLFVAACCRHHWDLLPNAAIRSAVADVERLAEGGERTWKSVADANAGYERVRAAMRYYEDAYAWGSPPPVRWSAIVSSALEAVPVVMADRAVAGASGLMKLWQARVLKDLFGNPLRPRPFVAPGLLHWSGGIVVQLAEETYEHRRLPEGVLDNARIAVLADALEEAGCTDEAILGHCRQQGLVHVRGCWVLDLVLGKG